MASDFTFIDLFAGIGGMRIPFDELNGKCIFTSELDKFARTTYEANFKNHKDHNLAGDIKNYSDTPNLIPEHDILLAGFPCQPFSIAGVSTKNALGKPHGFLCEAQGTLFYNMAKIIEHHRPKAILLENVKNLEHHNSGHTFKTIKHILKEELGYEFHARVIDSAPWLPQKRERIFIVGFKYPTEFNFDDLSIPAQPYPTIGTILESNVDKKYTLSEKLWSFLQRHKTKHQKAGNNFGYSLVQTHEVSRTLSARYYKDGSEILIKQSQNRPRKLTPRECSRLMGFDTPQGSSFIIPVSNTQAYRQFGNAVAVPVVRAIAQLIIPIVKEMP